MTEPKYRPDFKGPVQGVVIGDGNHVTIVYQNGEKRTVPFMAPQAPENFVSSGEIESEVKNLLLNDRNRAVLVLIQTPGVGKTAMAAVLACDEQLIKHFPDGVLWAGLGRDPKNAAIELRRWAKALEIPSEQLADSNGPGEWAKAIHDKIGMSRMLLILDDVWSVKDLYTFNVGGPNCRLLVTTRLQDIATEFDEEGIKVVHELSEDNGLELLKKLAPKVVEAEPEEAMELVRDVGALPQALVILGRYLRKESFSGQERRIKAALDKVRTARERLKLERPQSAIDEDPSLPEGMMISLSATIRVSDESLDKDARKALRDLSVLRPKPNYFSEGAAMDVTESGLETLDKLVSAGLVEVEGSRYSIPRTISDYAALELSASEADACHRRAINYFASWLREYEEKRKDSTPYQRMYSYEDPEWQAASSAWLYHLAHSTERTDAYLTFAKLYLDAFWWWGCYRPFPFCERLLEEWETSEQSPEDHDWLEQLRKFHSSYPTGYEKRGKGDWKSVEESMLNVRKRLALEGDSSHLNSEQCHVRALTDIFLAESYRYRNPADTKVDDYYAEALSLFKEAKTDDDNWNVPWTLCHLGDLWMERGKEDKTLQYSTESIKLAEEADDDKCEWDHEVIANDYRIQADMLWQQGETEKALIKYSLAVQQAYIFQGCPEPPDFYTVDFYKEMTSRSLARLRQLWKEDQHDIAVRECGRLRNFWGPYRHSMGSAASVPDFGTLLDKDDDEELGANLFPKPPTEEEVVTGAQEYVDHARKALEAFTDIEE